MGNFPTKLTIERSKAVKRSPEPGDMRCHKKSKIVASPLQLTDINDDCLEHTFGFLDLKDLVNIAEADDRFIPAAISAFSRYHRKKKVFVNFSPFRCERTDCIEVRRDKSIEAFFLHFGHIFSNLMISFFWSTDIEIENLLGKYCTNTLVNLELSFLNKNTFETINKRFTKLKKLVLIEASLGSNLSKLSSLFPNLLSLELVYINLSHIDSFEAKFQHLTHLKIYNQDIDLPTSKISELLHQNRQLKSLVLMCDYDVAFLRSLSQSLLELEELELWSPQSRFSDFDDHKINFKNVTKFTLNTSLQRGDFVTNMPFEFNDLRELTLDGFNQFKGQLLDFVAVCKGLTKLKLIPFIDDWDDLICEDLEMVVASLPNLIELEFCADTFFVQDIIQFLAKFKNLKKVNLFFIEQPVCQYFHSKIAKEWTLRKQLVETHDSNTNMDYYCFSLKRNN